MLHPFPYQSECLERLKAVRASRALRALVVMASGLGKTVTAALDIKQWLEEHKKGRVLYVCHQNEILAQAKTTFQAILGNHLSYGFLHGEQKTLHEVDCLFASFQTLVGHHEFFKPEEFDYILVDESHHTHAETYLPVVNYYKPKFMLGVTATPDRSDGLDIRSVFGQEIYSLSLEEALAKGYLAPVDYRLMTDEIILDSVLKDGEDKFSLKELNRRIFISKRDDEIAKIIQKHSDEISEPRIIVFCSSIAHCDYLCPYLTNGLAIHSKIPTKEKGLRLELFRQGIINLVLTVDCFNEGIDIPEANLIIFLRSTASATIFLQQLGRGLRRNKEKDKVVVLDFVGNCERVKFVADLAKAVKKIQSVLPGVPSPDSPVQVSGEGFKFTFSSKAVDLLFLMERIKKDFYPTWEEASDVAKGLKITTKEEYAERYKEDRRLPSDPVAFYGDLPGWAFFFNGKMRDGYYPTWQEASQSALKLGITSSKEYRKRYKEDPLLPSNLNKAYEDFPGIVVFLGGTVQEKYKTWQQASEAALKLGIPNQKEYYQKYKQDPCLPSSPQGFYGDFPGFVIFLGGKEKTFYETWQQAGKAAQSIGLSVRENYMVRYKEDDKLPSNPDLEYENFPGWKKFLGRE